jgi:transcription-repair coupling factor (superfamily II helicase)
MAQAAGIVHVVEKKDWLELKWQQVQHMPAVAKLDAKVRKRFYTVPDSPLMLRVSLQYIPDILTFLNYLFNAFNEQRKGNSLD